MPSFWLPVFLAFSFVTPAAAQEALPELEVPGVEWRASCDECDVVYSKQDESMRVDGIQSLADEQHVTNMDYLKAQDEIKSADYGLDNDKQELDQLQQRYEMAERAKNQTIMDSLKGTIGALKSGIDKGTEFKQSATKRIADYPQASDAIKTRYQSALTHLTETRAARAACIKEKCKPAVAPAAAQ